MFSDEFMDCLCGLCPLDMRWTVDCCSLENTVKERSVLRAFKQKKNSLEDTVRLHQALRIRSRSSVENTVKVHTVSSTQNPHSFFGDIRSPHSVENSQSLYSVADTKSKEY